MRRSLRQATHFFNQFFPADAPCRVDTLALRQLRNRRTASHRRHAPFGKKTNFGDLTAVESNAQFENVSAHGILQSRGSVRCFDRTWVSRILKMIENFSRVHRRIVMCPLVHRPGYRRSESRSEVRDQIAKVNPLDRGTGLTSTI